MSLRAVVRTPLLDVTLAAAPGEVVAVVGPNGAGKTTLLRALAGLVRSTGRLELDGIDVSALPPPRRRVGYVPQDPALFPHLTVAGNVAFGPRAAGLPGPPALAREWLDRLGIAALAGRRPRALSGGPAQRVALARALATSPRLLLLDEPLAALDGAARTDVRRALREHLSAFDGVTLLVSHDPVDAATLAHRVVVLAAGRVVQDGAPTEVTRAPRSEWVARMLGWNACLGRGAGSAVALPGGASLVVAEPVPGEGVVAAFPPWAVALHRTRPAGSPRNAWPGTVREVTAVGGRLRVRVVGDPGAPPDVVAEATPDAAAALGLAEGTPVWASVKATEILVTAL